MPKPMIENTETGTAKSSPTGHIQLPRRHRTKPVRPTRSAGLPAAEGENHVPVETAMATDPTSAHPSALPTSTPMPTDVDQACGEQYAMDSGTQIRPHPKTAAARKMPSPIRDESTDAPKREVVSPQIESAFKRYRDSALRAGSGRAALAMAKMMRIRLPYPRQLEGMAEIEILHELGLELRGEEEQQLLALCIFERSGCGKSTLAAQYKLMRNQYAHEGTVPVIHATMGSSGTAKDLYVAIMAELGDGFPTSGTEHSLRLKAKEAMEAAGVELLILDEAQHSGQKSRFSTEVTAELKIMLNKGKVPIVLLGTEAASPLIKRDRELAGRMFSPCRLGPLSMTDDFDLWQGFLAALDERMVEDGIVTAPAGLADPALAEALGHVCSGIIGQLMRVMLMALRNTILDNRTVIAREDIEWAIDEWSIALRFSGINDVRDLRTVVDEGKDDA